MPRERAPIIISSFPLKSLMTFAIYQPDDITFIRNYRKGDVFARKRKALKSTMSNVREGLVERTTA